MRFKYRKPITSLSEEELYALLEPHFGDRDKGEYFIGMGVGPGWSDIIQDLHKALAGEHPDYVIHQVKEKFGTLRFYTGGLNDWGWGAIREAEDASAVTCEECGRPGKLRDGSWIRTLCGYDSFVDSVNKEIWNIQRGGLTFFFKRYMAVRRWKRKRKESAED